jgi:hypothetical protein
VAQLVGSRTGERCIIEHTEVTTRTRYDGVVAANDWLECLPHWEGRIAVNKILTSTFEEAAENSRRRCEALGQWRGSFALDSFRWLAPPVLNACTRIAVEMCPARGVLRAVGYELAAGRDVPDRVTLPSSVSLYEIDGTA